MMPWRGFEALVPYWGGKRKLCPRIFREIARVHPAATWSSLRLVDPFLGGGSVSLYAKAHGFGVLCGDQAERSVIIRKALIENDEVRISDDDLLRLFVPAEGNRALIESRYVPDCFTEATARFLDNAFAAAEEVGDETKRHLLRLLLVKYIYWLRPHAQFSSPGAFIRDNDWNPNAFDAESYPKLVASIREKGILEPLKVMPDPEEEGRFVLVHGYHRWRAAGELGLDEVPCEVWEISAEEAKVRGLQLNYLRGQPVPRRLAELVHDLHRTYSVEDLAKMLPWSATQLKDSLELLKLPADLRERLDRQAQQEAAEAPVPVTVVLLGQEHTVFQEAMAAAKQALGKGARRGQCLERICQGYLAGEGGRDGG